MENGRVQSASAKGCGAEASHNSPFTRSSHSGGIPGERYSSYDETDISFKGGVR
jgi:hypothetical protein